MAADDTGDAVAQLASRRVQYESAGLDVADVDADPMAQWQRWYAEAAEAGCVEPNAFVLSTVDDAGWPQSRYLLARGADADGFTFFTNYESAKSEQLAGGASAGRAAMLFTWLQLHRQVRVVGHVQRLDPAASDAYFASRPRSSQLGAWASPQSQAIPDRGWLEARVGQFEHTFAAADSVPRPVYWGGWQLRPVMWEFWQGRPSRLHDRVRYHRADAGADSGADSAAEVDTHDVWSVARLAP